MGERGPAAADAPADGFSWRRSAKALLVVGVDVAGAVDGAVTGDSAHADGDAAPPDRLRLFLLQMCDPGDPGKPAWWELPGGGLEPGEDERTACAREVAEETGWQVDPADVGPGLWTRRATFVWLGTRRWQAETVHLVRLRPGTPRGEPVLTGEEDGSLLSSRWWSLTELAEAAGQGVRTYPGRLLELAPRLLAGEQVDEGFEAWD